MNSEVSVTQQPTSRRTADRVGYGNRSRRWQHKGAIVVAALMIAGGTATLLWRNGHQALPGSASPSPLHVTVGEPLVHDIDDQTEFWGQFSAVDQVEIRAQVGGTLSEIHFQDGKIVHKGDLLFVIDTRPYEIALKEAIASVKTAQARLDLANVELWRAQQLKKAEFGTAENVDQRHAERDVAAAALNTAQEQVADAELNLEYCHVGAPFTGRISNRRVSVGDLVSGSRAETTPATLLTTLVSLDPVYLDFDMSESEFLDFEIARHDQRDPGRVAFRLSNEETYDHRGTLNFVDNAINRGSGTIHVRATVDNHNLSFVPGQFATIELRTGRPRPALLVPDSSVSLDQSGHVVMTVGPDGTVIEKQVTIGNTIGELRVVRSGLAATDHVITDGLLRAKPGAKVTPELVPIRTAAIEASD